MTLARSVANSDARSPRPVETSGDQGARAWANGPDRDRARMIAVEWSEGL